MGLLGEPHESVPVTYSGRGRHTAGAESPWSFLSEAAPSFGGQPGSGHQQPQELPSWHWWGVAVCGLGEEGHAFVFIASNWNLTLPFRKWSQRRP